LGPFPQYPFLLQHSPSGQYASAPHSHSESAKLVAVGGMVGQAIAVDIAVAVGVQPSVHWNMQLPAA